jgi:glutamine synthetase
LRYLVELKAAGVERLVEEASELVEKFTDAIFALEKANAVHPDVEGLEHSLYMRDEVLPAMDGVRAVADKLEKIVADDLWPLPKYSEMLFIK